MATCARAVDLALISSTLSRHGCLEISDRCLDGGLVRRSTLSPSSLTDFSVDVDERVRAVASLDQLALLLVLVLKRSASSVCA